MVLICKILIFFIVALYATFLALILIGMKYRNPYSLTMLVGKKGAGKTTLITKLAFRYVKRGWKVYSNVPVPGAYLYKTEDIGKIQFDANSVVFCDEIGMVFDNRNFKNFTNAQRDWFKLQRHYRVKFFAFSQAWDVDLKIRALTDAIYLIDCYFNVLSIARKVRRKITIVHPSGESESRIADDLEFTPWYMIPFGGLMVTWLPSWMKYFDSFDAPELEPGNFVLCPMPEDVEERTLRFQVVNFFYCKLEAVKTWIWCHYWQLRIKLFPLSAEEYEAFNPLSSLEVPPSSDADKEAFEERDNRGDAASAADAFDYQPPKLRKPSK